MARLALNLVVRKELARYIRSFVLLYTRENSHSDAHHRRHLVQQNNFSPSNKCCVPNEAVAVDNEPVEPLYNIAPEWHSCHACAIFEFRATLSNADSIYRLRLGSALKSGLTR
jgi:hypothetical protein